MAGFDAKSDRPQSVGPSHGDGFCKCVLPYGLTHALGRSRTQRRQTLMDHSDAEKLRQAVKEIEFLKSNPSAASAAAERLRRTEPTTLSSGTNSHLEVHSPGQRTWRPAAGAPALPAEGTNFIPVIRDTLIVWVLTAIGGFVASFAADKLTALAVSDIVLATVGFTISGCLARSDRWRHLANVGLAAWLTSLINIPLVGITFVTWFFGAAIIAITAGVGGGISFLFKPASIAAPRQKRAVQEACPSSPASFTAQPVELHNTGVGQPEYRLNQLKRLHELGLITTAEYAAKRQEIVAGL